MCQPFKVFFSPKLQHSEPVFLATKNTVRLEFHYVTVKAEDHTAQGARGKSRGTVLDSDATRTGSTSSTSKCPMRSQAFLPSFADPKKGSKAHARVTLITREPWAVAGPDAAAITFPNGIGRFSSRRTPRPSSRSDRAALPI